MITVRQLHHAMRNDQSELEIVLSRERSVSGLVVHLQNAIKAGEMRLRGNQNVLLWGESYKLFQFMQKMAKGGFADTGSLILPPQARENIKKQACEKRCRAGEPREWLKI